MFRNTIHDIYIYMFIPKFNFLNNNISLNQYILNLTAERLHSFVIEIFSQNPSRCSRAVPGVCYNYTGPALSAGQTPITCHQPTRGRFVRVRKWQHIDEYDALTLCEVEIYSSDNNNISICLSKGCSLAKSRRSRCTQIVIQHFTNS